MSEPALIGIKLRPPRERFLHCITLPRQATRRSQYWAARHWCEERFGPRDIWGDAQSRWTVFVTYADTYVIYDFAFLDPRDAVEFRLRWS